MMITPLPPGEHHASVHLVRTTLGELAGELPHGLLKPDGAPTTYAFNPPTVGTRKRLGALKGRKDLDQKPGMHTAYWLATALSHLDGVPMASLKIDEAALRVAQLTIGDILYLLFAWQHWSRPDGLPLTATGCGVCGHPFDQITVDLGTLEVMRLPRAGDQDEEGAELPPASLENPPLCRVGLHKGMPHGDKHVQTVMLAPPKWVDTIYKVGKGQMHNNQLLRAVTLQAQIVAASGIERMTRLPMEAIDELWPVDVEAIDRAAELVTPTPNLEVEVACPSETCDAINRTVLDWQEPVFFGSSTGG